jgi:hypothetical protein
MAILERADRILGRTHNWFFVNVEARVPEARQPGQSFELLENTIIAGVVGLADELWTGRAVHVNYAGAGAGRQSGDPPLMLPGFETGNLGDITVVIPHRVKGRDGNSIGPGGVYEARPGAATSGSDGLEARAGTRVAGVERLCGADQPGWVADQALSGLARRPNLPGANRDACGTSGWSVQASDSSDSCRRRSA